MKWREPEPRPYYAKYRKLGVSCDQGWYECYELPGDVACIAEPQHLQEVNAFLLRGSERDLLIDTGLGVRDIRSVVEELLGRPASGLAVVNTHRHFDHVGGNHRFDQVFVADEPAALAQARTGIAHHPLANQADEDMFLYGYPAGFDAAGYHVEPYRAVAIPDGHVFDLGDRQVEFMRTPGHTEDSAMLLDRTNGILFGGDMVYLATIYAEFNNEFMGHSDVGAYAASLDAVLARAEGLRVVYASHNDPVVDPSAIPRIRDALRAIAAGGLTPEPMTDPKWGYFGDPEVMDRYWFEGFSVVV